ncbi:MAG: alpha/beta fold hydrolase, partial [Bacteroidota bacterium]|nr:alpha/beta fold hydrolase [Bacteroidota bacterium]MDX5430722.1 alpha/beta fold hydrolase [Bacteroidota bacterium]MDX5469469.1 alpha/beta fold hydrolase [Bacteroidota bacterium]
MKMFNLIGLLLIAILNINIMQAQNPSWLDTQAYPYKPHYFELDGAQMHYVDEGEGEILLFIHGTPSWSFDFRHQIQNLSKTYRCMAIDHIGFGLSDKPKDYPYSTQQHASNLEKFILEKDLQNITLIVHDFGGPIGMSVAEKYPERFKRFVLFNSWLWSAEKDPAFQKMKKVLRSPLLPFLYLNMNFSPSYLLPNSFGERKLSKSLK